MKINHMRLQLFTAFLSIFLTLCLIAAPSTAQPWMQHAIAEYQGYSFKACAADVDGDGDEDLFVTSRNENMIGWIENSDGGGTIWNRHVISGFADARFVKAADMDGDGDMDVLGIGGYIPPYGDPSAKIKWWENVDGTGHHWAVHTIDHQFEGGQTLDVADFDGDGDLDVIADAFFYTGYYNANGRISWWENPGNNGNNWLEHQLITNISHLDNLKVTDMDNDGDYDFIVSYGINYQTSLYYWENIDGLAISWEVHTIVDNVFSTTVDDIDNDGDPDIIGCLSDFIVWFENVDGLGLNWITYDIYNTNQYAYNIPLVVTDVDDDTYLDLIFRLGEEIIWMNNNLDSGSSWTYHVLDQFSGSSYDEFISANLDNDEDNDLLMSSLYGVSWWCNVDGSGLNWEYDRIEGTANLPDAIHKGDIDGDGDLDIIGTARFTHEVLWLENMDGSGMAWTEHIIDYNIRNSKSVYGADIDGDGDIDVVAGLYDDVGILWWENNDGTGQSWTRHVIENMYSRNTAVIVADVDGDNDNDIVAAYIETTDRAIRWFENANGDGSIWTEHLIQPYVNAVRNLHIGDIDGDSDLDVISGSGNPDNDFTWWENVEGNGENWTGHEVGDLFGAFSASSVRSADIDGDGDLDIYGTGSSNETEFLCFLNLDGLGTTWALSSYPVNSANSACATDIDNDSDLDIILSGGGTYNGFIKLLVNANGAATEWEEYSIDDNFRSPVDVLSGDMDNDGDNDVISAAGTSYYNGPTFAWWENDPLSDDVSLNLMPISPTFLPATGGTLIYNASLISNSPNLIQEAVYLTSVTLPGGGVFRPLVVEYFNIQPFMNATVHGLTQYVPANAPAGTYQFKGIVGLRNFPTEWTSDSFTFSKAGDPIVGDNVTDPTDWTAAGEFVLANAGSNPVADVPKEYRLNNAYPNPFNPTTTITVSLPQTSEMTVIVFNVAGQQVAQLAHGVYPAGNYQLLFNADDLASGLYFVRAQVPGKLNETQKMMLVR